MGEAVPLSWAQERFRLLDAVAAGTTTWHIHNLFRLRGRVEVPSLEQALRDLHRRHDILRTRLITRDAQVYQEASADEPELHVLDLRGLDDRYARIDALDDLVARPFDLETGPLWRAGIARIADDEVLLFLRFHHVVIDVGSMGIVLRELAELYTARSSGRVSTLKPLTRQYMDYAAWQRSPHAAKEHAQQIAYWTAQLRDAHPLELTTDRRRSGVQSRTAGRVRFSIPPPLLAALTTVSERQEATLFIGLLTAFEVLLSRYCDTTDVSVATPTQDSRDQGTRGLIGPFVNAIILRANLAGVDSFDGALQRVRDVVIEGLENKDVPFQHVLEALHSAPGSAARVDVMFSMPPPMAPPQLSEIVFEQVRAPLAHTDFDLELLFTRANHDGQFVYNADLFDPPTIERMARHYLHLLAQLVAAPTRSLASIELIDDEEREQLQRWSVRDNAYVLDNALRLAPTGVPGDLYVGGRSSEHRTGERARWRYDGSLERLGRADQHVRLRGHRIALGEIQAVLKEVVREAVVIVREDTPGDMRLVAYVVEPGVDVVGLRSHVQTKLPHYMMPSTFIVLDEMPLTRDELPAPDRAGLGYVAPRTADEETLIQIWQEILGLSRVGIHDDFFALGGHSLPAMRLLAQIERVFSSPTRRIRIPLQQLFVTPTVHGLAGEIRSRLAIDDEGSDERPRLVATQVRKVKLLAPQRGTYRVARNAPANILVRQNWSSWFDGPLDPVALERAFVVLVQRHDVLRARFFEEDGESWQEVLEPPRPFVLERVDFTALAASEQENANRSFEHEFLHRPFDLASGEVMRAALVAMSPTRHRLTISVHRVICDDETKRLLVDDLMRLFRELTIDPTYTPPVDATARQYFDLADYLPRLAASQAGARQRAYWLEQLAGVPPLELPVDLPRQGVDAAREKNRGFVTFPAGDVTSSIPAPLLASIRALAQREHASILSTLLAAMAAHLSALSGQTDLAIVTHLVYRHLPGLQETIGLFGNPLMVRISTDGSPSFRELIARSRDSLTRAFENGECDVLSLAPPHVFRLWFNYLYVAPSGETRERQLPPGLTVTPAELPSGQRRIAYDLILFLRNNGDRVWASLAYNQELFTETGARALLDGYLERVAALVRTS